MKIVNRSREFSSESCFSIVVSEMFTHRKRVEHHNKYCDLMFLLDITYCLKKLDIIVDFYFFVIYVFDQEFWHEALSGLKSYVLPIFFSLFLIIVAIFLIVIKSLIHSLYKYLIDLDNDTLLRKKIAISVT